MVWGGMIFAMLMMEGCAFYYGNGFWDEAWVNFSSMLELAGSSQSDIYIALPHPLRTAYTEFVEYEQASS